MIREVAKFIELKTGFKLGGSLQVGWRPSDSPDRCQLVQMTAGGMVYFDLPDRNDAVVSVITRALTQQQAYDDAWVIFTALHGAAGYDLPVITSGVTYEAQTIEALASPQYIGQDEKERFEYSTNYVFRIKDASL